MSYIKKLNWERMLYHIAALMEEEAFDEALDISKNNPNLCREAVVKWIDRKHNGDIEVEKEDWTDMSEPWYIFATQYMVDSVFVHLASGDSYA